MKLISTTGSNCVDMPMRCVPGVSQKTMSGGNGSISQPWDLQTALNQPASLVPGATLYLRAGTYTGKFFSYLTGSAASPITVKSYPGEWAIIDAPTLLNNAHLSGPVATASLPKKLP